MALFQKKGTKDNPLAALESELEATRRKRNDLVARRDKIASSLAGAEEARKQALLIDDDDTDSGAALAKAASNCESYRSSLQGVDLVLAEHDAKIGELQVQIEIGKSRAERETKAAALEEKVKNAQAAFDKYLAAANELSQALDGTKLFEADEAIAWVRRIANDLGVARPRIFQSIDRRVAELRADPPKPAVQPEPPPPGEVSPYRRQFSTLASPGAVGDRAPDHQYYYGGFAERT